MLENSETTEPRAIALFLADGMSAGVWYCPKCKRVGNDLEMVEQCCEPIICSVEGCENTCKKHWTVCEECRIRRRQERCNSVWNKATLIELSDAQHLLCPEDGDRLVCHDTAITMAEEDGVTRFYDTSETPLRLHAEAILEHAVDDWYEDAYSELAHAGAVESLQKVLDSWCEENPHSCWFEDNARKVDLSSHAQEDNGPG